VRWRTKALPPYSLSHGSARSCDKRRVHCHARATIVFAGRQPLLSISARRYPAELRPKSKLGPMKTSDPAFPAFPDDVATALGHLLVRFQSLERSLTFAVGRFMNPGTQAIPPSLTLAVLNELPFKSLVKIFAALPAILLNADPPFPQLVGGSPEFEALASAFENGAKLATAVEERRNQLVHSDWLWMAAPQIGGAVLRSKSRTHRKNGMNPSMEQVTAHAVEEAIKQVNEAMREVALASAALQALLFPDAVA